VSVGLCWLRTGDGVDAHPAVALDEQVDGVLEHPGAQQQRGDVVEHDACRARKALLAGGIIGRRGRGEERVSEERRLVPCLGKCGTTRMASEMPCSRGSAAASWATTSATAGARPFSFAGLALVAASIALMALQLASSPIISSLARWGSGRSKLQAPLRPRLYCCLLDRCARGVYIYSRGSEQGLLAGWGETGSGVTTDYYY
jgi:hypothetical protein